MTTTPGTSVSTGADQYGDVKQTAAQETGQVAQTAKDDAKNVAAEAKGQVQNVAAEAKSQARDLGGELQGQLRQQSDVQRDRVVSVLQELGDELRELADKGNTEGLASDLARRASSQVHGVSNYLEGRGPGDLLDDLRSFARRRPGAFLIGAAAAGVLAGRATRGVKAASSSGGSTGTPSAPVGSAYGGLGDDVPTYTGTTTSTGPAYSTPAQPGTGGTAAGLPVAGLESEESYAADQPAGYTENAAGLGLAPDERVGTDPQTGATWTGGERGLP